MHKYDIFLPSKVIDKNISMKHKITYTELINNIPKNSVKTPIEGWQSKYTTEWRWRFLKFIEDKVMRHVVEISYMKMDGPRMFLDEYGEWIEKEIDPVYDRCVQEAYYVYVR